MNRKIEHIGSVVALSGHDVTVRMTQQPACAGCAAQGICTPAVGENRDVQVRDTSERYVTGEQVMIVMQQRQGFRALAIGYLLPFVVVIVAMAVSFSLTNNELTSGLVALTSLIPYYIIVWLIFRKASFGFTISKLDKT